MLAFIPGIVLAFVYRRHFYGDVQEGRFSSRVLLQKSGMIFCDGAFFCLLVMIFGAACAALLLLLTPDPLIAFKTLAARFIPDSLMRWGFPALWFGLFGVLLAPVVLFSYYTLYKKRRAAFVFFALLFVPYLLGVWYQASIRYIIYLILPLATGFSLIPIHRWDSHLRVALALVAIASCLYPFGPLVYYYDYTRFERVVGLSAKPYIYFDSEYKKNQYENLCRLLKSTVRNPEEQRLLDSYRGSALLAYIQTHICSDKKNPRPR
jgi:hypothetical protein